MAIDEDKLDKLNKEVYENGAIDRSHLLQFLRLVPDNDSAIIVKETRNWLQTLHGDEKYDKIRFPDGDIESILGDLDSYGRVQPETIQEFKQHNPKTVD